MMKNLSTRLVEYGITVNDVAPAMIGDTGMFPSTDTVPGVVDTIPVGRLGKPGMHAISRLGNEEPLTIFFRRGGKRS